MGGLEGVACFRTHPVGAASGRELPFLEPAGGALPRREVIDLIHALEDIDAALGGDGAARLPEAVERLSRKGPADGRKRRR